MSKQFLVLVDEMAMLKLKALFASDLIQFLQVQGMTLQTGNANVLVTPIIPPVPPMMQSPPPEPDTVPPPPETPKA